MAGLGSKRSASGQGQEALGHFCGGGVRFQDLGPGVEVRRSPCVGHESATTNAAVKDCQEYMHGASHIP